LFDEGTLFVITAPSGTGKTSLVHALLASMDHLKSSVSYTTRPKRSSETDGVHYHFVSEERFQQMIADDLFYEYAKVFDYYYGCSKEWIVNQLQLGMDVILEIDWQGAEAVRKIKPECISIFILPPSLGALEKRLRARQQDQDEVIRKRLAAASSEMAHVKQFDYLVINNHFVEAFNDLSAIIHTQRLTLDRQAAKNAGIIAELLKDEQS